MPLFYRNEGGAMIRTNALGNDGQGGGGGFTFTGKSAVSMFNYFKDGGRMSGLSFQKNKVSWWTDYDDPDADVKGIGELHMLKSAQGSLDFMDKWYDTGSKVNWLFSSIAAGIGNTAGSFRLTNGAYNGSAWSPKYYSSAWRGGSRAKISTYNISRIGGILGKASFVAGLTMDGIGVYNYYNNPSSDNKVHPAKAGLNTTMGAYGLTGAGTIPALLYFGVDAFYPGGWEGYGNDYQSIQSDNVAIMPGFITAPYGSQKF
ncbi:hypothetical protein DBR28_18655 [Chryseobacterium sp. HMWF028]|nr:hypothetical protein DBR28_18655 [Chryseobacterium sp. HMWF028]